jgi:TP901 family phage tail tape measure protein
VALERVGLGAILTADPKPMVAGTGRARNALGQFVSTADQVPPHLNKVQAAMWRVGNSAKAMGMSVATGLRAIGAGISSMAMAFAPMGLLLGFGIKKAADFEKQMSAVGAVSRATGEEMAAMSKEAKRMGIVSAFSATQSSEGMEKLARAGAKPHQIIAGLSGVMNAAAADGIELATSANVIAQVVKGMGIEWEQSAHVADTLALASASANTDIVGLGEGFKLAVSTAKQMNMEVEETTAILGKLADAGLKGTLGGTAFANMMTKMAAPTSKATGMLKKWKVSLVHLSGEKKGSLKKVSTIVQDVSKHLNKLGDVTKRVAAAKEIFGLRGMRAYNALAVAGKDATDKLENALVNSSKGIGAAQEMADRRLDNLMGRMTLFGSSVEGLFNEIFGPGLSGFQKTIRSVTDSLNQVLFALQDMQEVAGDGPLMSGEMEEMTKKYGTTTVKIALGIRDAVTWIKDAWQGFTDSIAEFSAFMEEKLGGDGVRTFVKFAIIIGVVVGAMAPLMLGFMMLNMLIGGLITIIGGVATILAAVFWPVVVAIGAISLAIALLKNENETFFEGASRLWSELKGWINDVWDNAISPFIDGIVSAWTPAIEELGKVWNGVLTQIKEVFTELGETSTETNGSIIEDWEATGQGLVAFLAVIAEAAAFVTEAVARSFQIMIFPLRIIPQLTSNVSKAFSDMASGKVLSGLARIGLAIVDLVLSPVRWVLKAIIELAELVGAADLIPKGMKDFTEKGLTGVFFPEEEKKKKPKIRKPKDLGKFGDMATDAELALEYGIGTEAEVQSARTAQEIMNQKAADRTEKKLQDQELKDAMEAMGKRGLNATINNRMCVNGEDLDVATAQHKTSIKERSGGMPQWQYGPMKDHGVEV